MLARQRLLWATAGFVAGFVASAFVAALVVTAGGYELDVPAGIGSDIGRTAMHLLNGEAFDDKRIPIAVGALLQVPLWLGLMGAPLLARRDGLDWREHLSWSHKPTDVPVGIAVGVLLQLVLVPALYEPIFWIFGDQDVGEAARSIVRRANGSFDVVVLVAMTALGAPIVEEIFFRGLVQGGLRDRYGPMVAVGLGAVIFAASHLQVIQFPALVLVGAAHGILVLRTGRISPAIWSHIAFNTVTVIALLG